MIWVAESHMTFYVVTLVRLFYISKSEGNNMRRKFKKTVTMLASLTLSVAQLQTISIVFMKNYRLLHS